MREEERRGQENTGGERREAEWRGEERTGEEKTRGEIRERRIVYSSIQIDS